MHLKMLLAQSRNISFEDAILPKLKRQIARWLRLYHRCFKSSRAFDQIECVQSSNQRCTIVKSKVYDRQIKGIRSSNQRCTIVKSKMCDCQIKRANVYLLIK